MKKELKVRILESIRRSEGLSRTDIAERLKVNPASVGYHLTKLRKDGTLILDDGLWHINMGEEPVKRTKIVEPVPEPEPHEPSVKLLLYAAQSAIAEAIAKIEDIEALVSGH